MRLFQARSPSALQRLDRSARLAYSAYLLLTVLGLCSAGLLHVDGMGLSAEQAATWWQGDEAGMAYPKSYRQLVELTHFHLFTEPVALLIVGHLYALSGDPARRKALLLGGTTLAILAQVGLPWAVTYGPAALAVLLLPVNLSVLLGFLFMAGVTTRDLWGRAPST